MAKTYDNLEDVRSKLLGTIVYYDGVPVPIKDVQPDGAGNFEILFAKSILGGRGHDTKLLTDPGFNFNRFNLGYANHNSGAYWWYRIPAKQYQQGIKANQMNYKTTLAHNGGLIMFKMGQAIDMMLRNDYPDFDVAHKRAMDGVDEGLTVAFHKDFAVSWDKIHKDLILEYKGKLIGHMPGKDIKLIDEFEHLYESCKEAVGVR